MPDTIRPMMRPKRPRMELKISMTRILTNLTGHKGLVLKALGRAAAMKAYRVGSAASANAALLPLMPTATPQMRLHIPTVRPDQNNAYPVKYVFPEYAIAPSTALILAENTIDMMTP